MNVFKVLFFVGCALTSNGQDVVSTITTTVGRTYENAKVTRSEPDGIVVMHSGGIAKIRFTDLPPDVQVQYGYDPVKAAEFSKQQQFEQAALREKQAAAMLEYKKQQAEAARAAEAVTQAGVDAQATAIPSGRAFGQTGAPIQGMARSGGMTRLGTITEQEFLDCGKRQVTGGKSNPQFTFVKGPLKGKTLEQGLSMLNLPQSPFRFSNLQTAGMRHMFQDEIAKEQETYDPSQKLEDDIDDAERDMKRKQQEMERKMEEMKRKQRDLEEKLRKAASDQHLRDLMNR